MGSCLQEGTVKIWLIEDAGTHIFILVNCLYHPDSPVNLISTRCLAEKFIDADSNPDKKTWIESQYLTHIITWSFRHFKKTFPTPVSGLPELLFDAGFWAYTSFCNQTWSSYANAVTDLTFDKSIYPYIIPFESQELLFSSLDDANNDAIKGDVSCPAF